VPEYRAAFLDRDGTLIRDVPYINDPTQVELLPGVVRALRNLIECGYLLIVVTNQSGIGRWRITKPQYVAVQRRMLDLLAQHGVYITATYYCPHTPDAGCACRKPGTELFERAAREFDIDLSQSLMFGDKESDMVPCVGTCIRVPKDASWAAWYRPRYPSPTPPVKTQPRGV
jgi:histidinol-phosphate phosphatase family protein